MDDLLLQKYLRNEISEKELVKVLDWLDADLKNQQYLSELDFISNVNMLTSPGHYKIRKLSPPVWKNVLKWSAGTAAALLVCAGLSYWFAGEIVDRNSQNMMAISAPNGQRMSVVLSDGTLVWLNSGATLEYPSLFSHKRRKVKVSGEAMFEVEHDTRRPFIVETFACAVEVLGTKFNICADADISYFSAALLEGKLKISNLNSNDEPVILSPNEVVDMVNGRLRINRISNHDDFMWTDGVLNLNNLRFEEVIRKFEKCYGVDIVIETPNIPQIKYKGKLKISDGVDYALQQLQLTSDFSYLKNDETNTIHIR